MNLERIIYILLAIIIILVLLSVLLRLTGVHVWAF